MYRAFLLAGHEAAEKSFCFLLRHPHLLLEILLLCTCRLGVGVSGFSSGEPVVFEVEVGAEVEKGVLRVVAVGLLSFEVLLDVEGNIASLVACKKLRRIIILKLVFVEGSNFDLDGVLPLLLLEGVHLLLKLYPDGLGVGIGSCI